MNEYEILTAMVLGDGNISKNDNRFNLTHSVKQEQYFIYKKQLLEKIFNKNINHYYFDNNGYPGIRFSINDNIFNTLRKEIYINSKKTFTLENIKIINKEGLSLLYMDDGSLCSKKRNNVIYAHELYLCLYCSELEADLMITHIFNLFGVIFRKRLNKGHYILSCGVKEAYKFIKIIEPYIHPSMTYKSQPLIEMGYKCLSKY